MTKPVRKEKLNETIVYFYAFLRNYTLTFESKKKLPSLKNSKKFSMLFQNFLREFKITLFSIVKISLGFVRKIRSSIFKNSFRSHIVNMPWENCNRIYRLKFGIS